MSTSINRVLISGASGLIGSALAASFEREGTEVVALARGQSHGSSVICWEPSGAGLDPNLVSGFDVVIHLAGESIVGRWTEKKKKAIRESRVRGTQNLATALSGANSKPRVFVCASAIGFYGDRGEEMLSEGSGTGRGFLPDVCGEWEEASRIAAGAGIRTVNLRTGLVLSSQGGALGKMMLPFRLGLGGRIGSGEQWWSWIHIDDVVGAVHHAIAAETVSGPLNMVAPNAVRNAEFTKVLASTLDLPAVLPVPGAVLKVAFGNTAADELFLSSQHVRQAKLEANGYRFKFADLRGALSNLV